MKNKKLIDSLVNDEDGYDTVTTVDASGDFTIAFVPRRKKTLVPTVEVLDEQLVYEAKRDATLGASAADIADSVSEQDELEV